MTNKNIVLHSPNPYLLMRMFTDLKLHTKLRNDELWNLNKNPFNYEGYNYLDTTEGYLTFFGIKFSGYDYIELTDRNYLSTLKKILQ